MLRYLITVFMALALIVPAGARAADVTFTAGANGTLSDGTTTGPTITQTIPQGSAGTVGVTANPDPGFHFYNWSWTNPLDAGNPVGTTVNPLIFPTVGSEATDNPTANFVADSTSKVTLHGLSNVVELKGGRSHSLARLKDGSVVAWGGDGDNQTSVINGMNLTGAKEIATGPYYSLALKSDGTVTGGGNWYLNNGTLIGPINFPAALDTYAAAHQGITKLAGGLGHSLALMGDGTVFAWGDNTDGQTNLPATLVGRTVVGIAAGHDHSAALTNGGNIIAWGGVSPAALGLGLTLPNVTVTCTQSSPGVTASCFVVGLHAVAVDAKGYHTVVLTADGKVLSFGSNELGQGNVPANLAIGSTSTDKAAAIAAGAHHTSALMPDGTVVTWGDDFYGETHTPAGLTGVTSLSSGSYHLLAMQDSTAVVSWGDDQAQQSELPLSIFAPISNGSVSCTPDITSTTDFVPYNTDSTCTVTPNSGYQLVTFLANGVPVTVTGTTAVLTAVKIPESVTAVFAKAPDAPTITGVTSPALGQAAVAFTAPASNGGSPIIDYTVTATSTGNPTLTNTASTSPITLTGLANGATYSITVTARNLAGSSVASTASSFTAAKNDQTITVTTHAPATALFNGTFPVAATASSTGSVAISGSGACSGTGTDSATITMTSGTGTCTVTYTQAGNATFNPVTTTETTTAQQIAQTITFNSISNISATSGGFTLDATASSSLGVVFTSETTSVCTVSGTTLTVVGPGTCTIDATQPGDGNFTAATTVTRSFTITPGVVASYTITAPASVTAGTPFTATVNAVDSGNFTVTTFAGTVALTTSAGTVTPTSVDLVNGTATVSLTLTGAGTAKTITATDTAAKTGSATLNVAPAAAETFSVAVPSSTEAGGPFDFTVTARDHFNNAVTNYAGTVHFTSSDAAATLPADYSFVAGDNGAHTFSATLATVGPQTITATDTVTAAITGSSNSITVSTPGAAKFLVTANATATAGSSFPVTVTVQDNFGNTITNYTGTVHFTSTDSQAVLPADFTFAAADNGTHTFDVTLKSGPSQTVTVTDVTTSSIAGTTGSVMIAPAAAAGLAFVQQPTTTIAGQPLTPPVTVRVIDQFGNTVTSSSAAITVAIATNPGNATLSGTTTQTAQAGIATFNDLSLDRNASGYTLAANSPGLTAATSNAFDIGTGALARFSFATIATQSLGQPFPVTITAQDAAGNTVSTFTATVDLTGTGATVTPATSGNFVNGVWTGNVTVSTLATGMTITAKTTGGTETGTSNAFDVVKATQTITTSTLPLVVAFQGTFDVTATASSSLPVTITASGACTGSGTGSATITVISGSGTCTLEFDQAGNGQFNAVQLVAQVNAGQIQQAIIIDTPAPVSATFGSSFTVAAHAPGGAVTYSSAGGCTNSGATFTMTSATVACTVTYSQEGNTVYFPAQVSTTTGAVAALPGAPTIFSVTAVNGQATILFVPPTQTGGSPITGYTVTATPGNITVTGTNSPITVTGLTNGTAYTFSLVAQNSAGNSTAAVSSAVTPAANGDINGDGMVDIRDAMLALRVATGLQSATPAMLAAADVAPLVNGKPAPDGKIDVGDVIVLLRKVVGLVTF